MQMTFYSRHDLLRMAGLAITYAMLAKLVLNMSTANGNVTIFWIPGGLALTALLVWGWRYWPAVFLGAFAAGIIVNDPPAVSIFLAIGNTLETVTAVWLLRRLKMDLAFNQLRDFFYLGLAATFCTLMSALIGPLTLLVAGYLNWQNIINNIFHWWQGDTLGILLSTPLFLIWRKFPHHWFTRKNLAETFALIGLCMLTGQFVFLGWFDPIAGHIAKGYWAFLFVVWAAVRRGKHGASLIVCITATQALLGATQGTGFFAQDIANTGLQNFWFYLLILTMVGIALATYVESLTKSELALKEAESKLRTIFNTIPDLIWFKDTHGVFHACNARVESFYGKKESEIIGKTDYDFVSKALADAFRKNDLAAMKRGRKLIHEEVINFASDGHQELLETTKTPVLDKQGNLIGVLGIGRDITERKKAENDLRIAAIAFESQEGICVTDNNSVILRINRAFTEITGYSSQEAIGHTTRSILASGLHDDVFYAAMWQTLINTGYWSGEIWNRHKNGKIYPEYLTITAVKDDAGILCNYVATMTDITDMKQQEQQRLAHEIALRNTLVREVHHRIKNSLQGVTGLLRQTIINHPELKYSVTEVISQIRSIAVIHGLQGANLRSQVLLQELLGEIAANNQSLWQTALSVNIHPNLLSWQINEEDAVPLALILNELVLNAIKHSHANTDVQVTLEEYNTENMVIVSIRNAGQLTHDSNAPHTPVKGTGLNLINLLLPTKGADLSWEQSDNIVLTRLALKTPVIRLVSLEVEHHGQS